MRIISGTHKGRRINPGNKLNLRPTTDRSKEALFNILENRYFFNNKNVLDLFSGTGNISLEFASRGTEEENTLIIAKIYLTLFLLILHTIMRTIKKFRN